MNRILTRLFSLALVLVATAAFAGPGYKIKVQIKGLENTQCRLAYYYGDKTYLRDSAQADTKGFLTFQSDTATLKGGVYMVVLPSNRYFEFLVPSPKEAKFSITTDTSDFVGTMKFEGSKENDLFYGYLNYLNPRGREAGELNQKLQETTNAAKQEEIKTRLTAISEEIKNYRLDLIKKNPGTLVANLLNMTVEVEVPENPNPADSTFAYRYYKAHYFDNVDFSDGRLIRSPMLHQKIDFYVSDKLTYPIVDSIITSVDKVVELARADPDIYQYTVVTLVNRYAKSKIMGHDAIYLHMAMKYYLSGQTWWSDSATIEKIEREVALMRWNQVGQPAVNLIMEDTSGQQKTLSQIGGEYIVLYFYSHTCGHCKKVSPVLNDLFLEYRNQGLQVWATDIDSDHAGWKKYVQESGFDWLHTFDKAGNTHFRTYYGIQSTPTIYLLDRNKKIVLKKVDVETIGEYLERQIGG